MDLHGNLIVPLYQNGELVSLQFIHPDGKKYLLSSGKGGRKKGSYYTIGDCKSDTIYICEGYATGASVHEATGQTVIIAVDAGNLRPVAKQLRKKYPNAKIVFCSDNDRAKPQSEPGYDVGYIRAFEAANAVDGYACMPEQPGTLTTFIFMQALVRFATASKLPGRSNRKTKTLWMNTPR
jgi:putative DNA primase/helicase